MTPGTGLITGTFVDPTSHLTNAIQGVQLQNSTNAAGYFLGTDKSGSFLLH